MTSDERRSLKVPFFFFHLFKLHPLTINQSTVTLKFMKQSKSQQKPQQERIKDLI